MLGSFRNFSSSIYAKVLLIIIIIPFVFWGMGSSLTGGNQNIIVVIDKEKYTIQQFTDFIRQTAIKKVEVNQIDSYLSTFIGEKLIDKEIEYYEIKLSNKSLSSLIKNQKNFMRDNKFSRTEYEKFLLKNNFTAPRFESLLLRRERKKQLLDLVGGGILPSKFLINVSYDRINQNREIELINLNEVFKNQLKFSEIDIKKYFDDNINKYKVVYKSGNFLELNPEKLVGNSDFNDLYFKKIDEIDDLIIEGENLENIIKKYNLNKATSYSINEFGENVDLTKNKNISQNLVNMIFKISADDPTILVEDNNNYYIAQLIKTENIEKNINDINVKKKILTNLKNIKKKRLTSEIINSINNNDFKKDDFNKLSKDKNVIIEKINLESLNDNKILKEEVVNQIYAYSEKMIIVVNEINFSKNYLVYIDKVKNTNVEEESEDYEKYVNLSKIKIANNLYNTYDKFLSKKYMIDINYQAVDTIKNYYN